MSHQNPHVASSGSISRRQFFVAGAGAAGLAGLGLSGCGGSDAASSSSGSSAAATPSGGTAAAVRGQKLHGMSHYIATVTSLESGDRGFKQATEQLGGQFENESYDGDQQKLLSQGQLFSSLGVNGVFAHILSDALVEPYATQLAESGIAYVNQGNRVPWLSPLASKFQGQYVAHLGGSFAENGFAASTAMFERGGGEGKAILLKGAPGAANDSYDFGHALALKEFPDVEVVAEGTTDWDRAKAREVAETLLSSNPDVKFIIGYNDSVALGALAAARALNMTDFLLCGADGDPELLSEIVNDERVVSTAALRVDFWGVLAAVLLFDHLNGVQRSPIECMLDIDAVVIDTPESAQAMLDLIGEDSDPLPYDATKMSRFLQGDDWEYPHRVHAADPVNFDWGDKPGVTPTKKPANADWPPEYQKALDDGDVKTMNAEYEKHTNDIYDAVRKAASFQAPGALGLFDEMGIT